MVAGVILVWLLTPLNLPRPSASSAISAPDIPVPSGSALAPVRPPTPTVGENDVSAAVAVGETSHLESDRQARALPTNSHDWNIISYSETDALKAHDNNSAESSLRISIPALDINAPVEPVALVEQQNESGKPYRQWNVPNKYAAGWHNASAPPGTAGNTVLNGHNNIHGAIFGNLVDLALGEEIIIFKQDRQYVYKVVHREFLPERGEPLRIRLRNARWISPSNDDRLTIVTCWPNTSNTHRLIVIALPLLPEPDV